MDKMDQKEAKKDKQNQVDPVEENLQDEEFFESLLDDEDRKPLVCREVARNDFGRILKTWKVLKKALRKARSNDKEIKETYESAKDLIIESIMDGTLVVENDTRTGCKMIHNLAQPIANMKGEVLLDKLIYRKVPKLVDLRKMDEFEDKEAIAKTQALAAAMSGKATKELANMSSADLDILGALFVFFV